MFVYLDDILIASNDEEEHKQHGGDFRPGPEGRGGDVDHFQVEVRQDPPTPGKTRDKKQSLEKYKKTIEVFVRDAKSS